MVPVNTAAKKIAAIDFYGGRVETVDSAAHLDRRCKELAAQWDGHFMDQFTYAERATDWRGNNNIAESLFSLKWQVSTIPSQTWVVVLAPAQDGTSATIGRYIFATDRSWSTHARLCVVDPQGSAYFPAFKESNPSSEGASSGIVEGIGRPRVEASFVPCRDRLYDSSTRRRLGGRLPACGWNPAWAAGSALSTGSTNIVGALLLAERMQARGRHGSIASLICDAGE